MLAEVVAACAGGAVLTGWALHLGFQPGMVGLLGAVPVVAHVFHLPAALLTERIGRRRLSLVALGLSRICWLLLPLLLLVDLTTTQARAAFVACLVVSSVLAVVGNNAWIVWMGELLPPSLHGRYFGRRTAALTLVGSLVSLASGIGLDRASLAGHAGPALASLSVVAGLAGLGCLFLLSRQHERRRSPRTSRPFAATLLAPLRDRALRPLLLYQLAWNAAGGVAATFFVAYLLRDLGLGFTLVAVHGAASAGARMVSAPLWGVLLDRMGPTRILAVTSLGVAFTPLLWIVTTPDRLWPLAIDAVVGGLLACGHGLALFGLPLRVAPRDALSSYVGALSSAAGAGFALSAPIAGFLAAGLPATFVVGGHLFARLHVLFLVAAVARVGASALAWRIVPTDR
jgi:MFS family permease